MHVCYFPWSYHHSLWHLLFPSLEYIVLILKHITESYSEHKECIANGDRGGEGGKEKLLSRVRGQLFSEIESHLSRYLWDSIKGFQLVEAEVK